MAFWETVWFGLALLNFALIELVIAEIIGYLISKETTYFVDSEYFVFGTLGFGLLLFFISNALQDFIIRQLANLRGWLGVILVIVFSLNVFFLAKFGLERSWGFRLVVIPLAVIVFVIFMIVAYSLITHFSTIE